MIETQSPTKRVMPTLLHLDSSMRHEGSRSRALSAHFAAAWQQANLDGTVVYRDLAADPIPHLDLTAFSANFVADDDRTEAQREARALTETLANELLAADEIVAFLKRNVTGEECYHQHYDRTQKDRPDREP